MLAAIIAQADTRASGAGALGPWLPQASGTVDLHFAAEGGKGPRGPGASAGHRLAGAMGWIASSPLVSAKKRPAARLAATGLEGFEG